MRRGCFASFMITLLWLLPAMVAVAVGGFFLARDVIGPRHLEPVKVQTDTPRPVRVLSPGEARSLAQDEPSHVWKDGVRPSDIPKYEPEPVNDSGSTHRPRRRTGTDQKQGTTTETPNTTAPPANTEQPSTPPPATGGTNEALPLAPPDAGDDGPMSPD